MKAKQIFRDMMALVPLDGVIDETFIAVLRHHPEWSFKSDGMICIQKVKSQINPHEWELHIKKNDGSCDDISWVMAIKALRGCKIDFSHRWYVRSAARTIVHVDQILPARETLSCKIEQEMDHVIPFEQLFRARQSNSGLKDEDIAVQPIQTYKLGKFYTFADAQLAESWRLFHQDHAVLQALDPILHRQKSAEDRKTLK
jgi:hypothetical protein